MQVIDHDEVEHTKSEIAILASIDFPFLVKLRFSFQTATRLFLVGFYPPITPSYSRFSFISGHGLH